MRREWKTFAKSAVMYGLVTALLFAGVFSLLGISGEIDNDMILGAISGLFSGLLISIVVGMFDQALARKEIVTGAVAWTISNSLVGLLAGALITTGLVFILVQWVGFASTAKVRSIFDLPLCCSFGIPLGITIGLLIGASWHSK